MERKISLVNIGKHKNFELNLSKGQVFAFMGKNGSGKSTIIRALETIFSVKGFMQKPVTEGEKKGSIIYEGNDSFGNTIKIEWEVEQGDTTGSFKALAFEDGKMKKVSSVTKIRELMGIYIAISSQEALSYMKTADGRRYFINNYIFPTLPEITRERIKVIDTSLSTLKNQSTKGNLYHTRTEKKAELDAALKVIETMKPTDEELSLIDKKEKYSKNIKELNNEKSGLLESNESGMLMKLSSLYDTMVSVKDIVLSNPEREKPFKELLESVSKEINEKNEMVQKIKARLEFINTNLLKGNELMTLIRLAEEKLINYNAAKEKNGTLVQELFNLESKIESLREEKKKLLASSQLPAGLSFDDDNVSFNGLPFDETVSSQTETQMAMIDLMLQLSNSELINIGDWSLYDHENKQKLIKIANEQQRIIIGQYVTDDTEIDVKVYMKG